MIAFDRPGFGYSDRPRGTTWTPEAQAALFHDALRMLDIHEAIVVAHSWATMAALAMALDHSQMVKGLVLLSGYYFPTARADVPFFAPPSIPVIGDLLRNTVAPFVGAVIKDKLIRKLFYPQRVPAEFNARFPVELGLRPGQIRASSEESALMVSSAARLSRRYGELRVPIELLAGSADRIADVHRQTIRLHAAIDESRIDVLPGLGHMIHYFALPRVVAAIHEAQLRSRSA